MPAESAAALTGLDVWIVDALRYRPHPSHFSLDDALQWIGRLKPRRAILTNLHADLDYEELYAKLPAHVEPAYRRHYGELPKALIESCIQPLMKIFHNMSYANQALRRRIEVRGKSLLRLTKSPAARRQRTRAA